MVKKRAKATKQAKVDGAETGEAPIGSNQVGAAATPLAAHSAVEAAPPGGMKLPAGQKPQSRPSSTAADQRNTVSPGRTKNGIDPAQSAKFSDAHWLRNMAELKPNQNRPLPSGRPQSTGSGRSEAADKSDVPGGDTMHRGAFSLGSARARRRRPPPPQLPQREFPFHPLIETFISHCCPYQLPAPWDCIPVDPFAFQGPADPRTALTALRARHPEEQLLLSRIVQVDADGELALHPSLAAPDVGLILLRDAVSGAFRDLVTETGCVIAGVPPLFEALADKHTFAALVTRERYMFVTEKLVDAVLLRSLGLAAAPIAGLSELDGCGIEMLGDYYGVVRELNERETEQAMESEEDEDEDEERDQSINNSCHPVSQTTTDQPTSSASPLSLPSYWVPSSGYVGVEHDDHVPLVLVRWSPHILSAGEPAATKRAIQYLKELAEYRQLQCDEVMQWAPQARDLEAMRFALSRRESGWAKDALLDSIYSGLGQLEISATKRADSAPTDLASAFERLHQLLLANGADSSPERRREGLRDYLRIAGRIFTGPMLREAESAGDLLLKSQWMQMAKLNSAFLSKAAVTRQQLLCEMTQTAGEPSNHSETVSEMLAISGRLVTLIKEIAKCKESLPKPPTIQMMRPAFDLSKRFGNLDLAPQN